MSKAQKIGGGLLLTIAGLFLLSILLPTAPEKLEYALPAAGVGILLLWVGGILMGIGQPVMTPDPAVSPRWDLVTVDIDGTLTTIHGWKVLAAAFGRRADFDQTQRRFFAHEIGEDEHLADMLAVAQGRTA